MSDVNPVLPTQENNCERSKETLDLEKEHEDLFNSLTKSQNTNAASIFAALVCLTVGFGSGDV